MTSRTPATPMYRGRLLHRPKGNGGISHRPSRRPGPPPVMSHRSAGPAVRAGGAVMGCGHPDRGGEMARATQTAGASGTDRPAPRHHGNRRCRETHRETVQEQAPREQRCASARRDAQLTQVRVQLGQGGGSLGRCGATRLEHGVRPLLDPSEARRARPVEGEFMAVRVAGDIERADTGLVLDPAPGRPAASASFTRRWRASAPAARGAVRRMPEAGWAVRVRLWCSQSSQVRRWTESPERPFWVRPRMVVKNQGLRSG